MRQDAHIKQYRKLKKLEYFKKWRQENREKYLEYHKKYRQENRERYLEYAKKWHQENREKRLEYNKKWQQENRERYLEYVKKYHQENRERYLENAKKWYQENREKVLERNEKWRQENREYPKKWYQENREKVLERNKRYFAKLTRPLNMGMYEIKYCLASWAKVIKKDNCQICGNPPKEAHHILYKKYYPELMLNENNGIALCQRCHLEAHGKKLDLIKPLEPIIDIRSFGVVGVKN